MFGRRRTGTYIPAMDILAAMFAYLACVTGIVGALAISLVMFFTPQALQPLPSLPGQQVVAMVAKPDPVVTIAAAPPAAAPATVAADVRQKPFLTPGQMRRLAEKERARRLAFREGSSFETRFLHYAD